SRDIRSLMTAQLAMAIAEAGGVSVPDPYLVARALGDGERRLELGEIFQLANAIGAKRIVVGYVGHHHGRDNKGTVRLTLHSYERSEAERFHETVFGPRPGKFVKQPVASDRLKSRHFENLPYLESTPIDAFEVVL